MMLYSLKTVLCHTLAASSHVSYYFLHKINSKNIFHSVLTKHPSIITHTTSFDNMRNRSQNQSWNKRISSVTAEQNRTDSRKMLQPWWHRANTSKQYPLILGYCNILLQAIPKLFVDRTQNKHPFIIIKQCTNLKKKIET
jgi:hypothetical protein